MELGSYIYQLLFDNEIVTIPGFGAFVSSYKPAQIDNKKETILPPSKEITFDRKLKNNDGLLANYVATSEGISRFEALKMIEEFRGNIQYRLEKGEIVEFDGLGTLKLDHENNTVFVSASDENFLLDSFGLGEISLKTEQQIQESGDIPTPEKPNIKSKVWLLFLLIPVAAGAVFVYLNFFIPKKQNNVQPETNILKSDTSVIEEQVANTDSVQTDFVKDTIKLSIEASEKTDVKILPGEKYYLIGGSFKEQENADKYFKKVEKLGHQPIHLGKQGNFYIVALGVFNSFDEADSAMNEYVGREPDSGIWIKKVGNQ